MKFSNNIERRFAGRHKKSISLIKFNDKKIIDIGCSIGWFEKIIGGSAKKIVAIDLCVEDIKIASENIKLKNVEFKKGSVLELTKLVNEKFDIAVMFEVIEHIPKNTEIKALKEINSVLNKSSILLLSTPCKNLSRFFDPAYYIGHRHYSKEQLEYILIKSGFKVNEMYARGEHHEMGYMFLFYIFKWIFYMEVPFKKWFDRKRDFEYLGKKGFVNWFVIAEKQ